MSSFEGACSLRGGLLFGLLDFRIMPRVNPHGALGRNFVSIPFIHQRRSLSYFKKESGHARLESKLSIERNLKKRVEIARRKPVMVRFASCERERSNSFIYRDVGVAVATVYFVGNSLRGIAVASRRSPGTELTMICFQGRESNRAAQTCRFSL